MMVTSMCSKVKKKQLNTVVRMAALMKKREKLALSTVSRMKESSPLFVILVQDALLVQLVVRVAVLQALIVLAYQKVIQHHNYLLQHLHHFKLGDVLRVSVPVLILVLPLPLCLALTLNPESETMEFSNFVRL